MICSHNSGPWVGFDAVGWLIIAGFAVYIAIVYRLDLWLWEKGLRWHSDSETDYANVLDPNVQDNVAKADDKIKQRTVKATDRAKAGQ